MIAFNPIKLLQQQKEKLQFGILALGGIVLAIALGRHYVLGIRI